jgi:hypothetical protein
MHTAIRAGRRAAFAGPAVASLILAGTGLQPAWASAAPASPAPAAALRPIRAQRQARPPGLRITATVKLGRAPGSFNPSTFTEAPDGTVFFARGSRVYVVRKTSAPVIAERAGGTVLALAASSADLFVQVRQTITMYRRSSGAAVRRWRVSSPHPVTFAGLQAAGGVLWSWTDWATDMSGFQYATVSRIATSSGRVHLVSRWAYPADTDADSSALYYEADPGGSSRGFLVRVSPSGVTRSSRPGADTDAPLAVSGGRVAVFFPGGKARVDTYSQRTLRRLSSHRLGDEYSDPAATGAGLLVIVQPCPAHSCRASAVALLNPVTAAVKAEADVGGAQLILPGAKTAVIAVTGTKMSLVRLS